MLNPIAPMRAYFKTYGKAGVLPAVVFIFLSGFFSLLLFGLWKAADAPLEALPAAITNPLQEPEPPNPNILQVIQASPDGLLETAQLNQEIVVVFNHPMVPLGRVKRGQTKVLHHRTRDRRRHSMVRHPGSGLHPGKAFETRVFLQSDGSRSGGAEWKKNEW